MTDPDLTRREFVQRSLTVAPAMLASNALPLTPARDERFAPMMVVCIGAHPDDPEWARRRCSSARSTAPRK